MAERNIHIGHLRIRLPAGGAGQAHAIADALGREILRALAEATEGKSGTLRVGSVETPVRGMQAGAPGTARRIAGRVAGALNGRIG